LDDLRVEHAGDYANFNSNNFPDDTVHSHPNSTATMSPTWTQNEQQPPTLRAPLMFR
jgi:hypothetical protein